MYYDERPMLIKPLLATILETALNQLIRLDEDVDLFLKPLARKVIAIHIQPFNQTLYLCPTTDNIQVLEQYVGEVDATISGSLPALGFMGLTSVPMASILNGEVSIEGNTEVAHNFQQLFTKLDIDWEEKLSMLTGDVIAHQLGYFLRQGKMWTVESLETFQLNCKEFLQQEIRDLPAEAEADIFYTQVDQIRSDVDRLSTRIEQLKKQDVQ